MTAEEVWISIGASILVGFLVLVIAKKQLWDPIAVRRQRVQGEDQLEDAVQRLVEMRMELYHLPWSSQRFAVWARSVQDLRAKAAAAGHNRYRWGLLIPSYLSSKGYLGKQQADEELKKAANDLIQEGKQLLEEAQARSRPVPRAVLHSCERNVVCDAILDDDGLVGIFGMPGVGKTFLLELVRDSQSHTVEEAPFLFDQVLFVRAGRGATVGTMQRAIAAGMGLTNWKTTDDEIYQRSIIYNHLKNKSFLLLIDDLRGYHDLKHLGIPMPLGAVRTDADAVSRGRRQCRRLRKVVFTTRSYHVCVKMRCAGNTIRLECWNQDDDVWKLVEDKLGNDEIINNNLHHLGKGTPFVSELTFESTKQLVRKCLGLPLALCTISRAMSTKKDPKEWERAIDLVKKLKLRRTIIKSDLMYGLNHQDSSSVKNRHDDDDIENELRELRKANNIEYELRELRKYDDIENELRELRKATDLVNTTDDDDGLLKAVLALVVMLTPVPKDRIIRYIRLKEIHLPCLHGMASYQTKVLRFVEEEDETCSLLGIWGLRGVGKTTLLRFVRDYAHDDLYPCDAFFVGAGSGCTVRRLQHALCVSIGLLEQPHMSDQASLAQLISNSLQGRPFLLLVDDVQERLDLAALGLPMPLRHNQKVIITTRNKAICTQMGCTKDTSIIHMQCLGKEDAWNLFKDKVGDEIIDSHRHIRRLAEQMVSECHGLPSAVCTLGRAMSTKRDIKEWRYVYDVLLKTKPPPHEVDEIQEMEDERYSHLYRLEDALLKHSFF